MSKLGEVLDQKSKEVIQSAREAAIPMVTTTGIRLKADHVECPACNGHGWLTEVCKNCDGKGEHENGAVCSKCHGRGTYIKKKTKNYRGVPCKLCHGAGQVANNNHNLLLWLEENPGGIKGMIKRHIEALTAPISDEAAANIANAPESSMVDDAVTDEMAIKVANQM